MRKCHWVEYICREYKWFLFTKSCPTILVPLLHLIPCYLFNVPPHILVTMLPRLSWFSFPWLTSLNLSLKYAIKLERKITLKQLIINIPIAFFLSFHTERSEMDEVSRACGFMLETNYFFKDICNYWVTYLDSKNNKIIFLLSVVKECYINYNITFQSITKYIFFNFFYL